MMPVIALVGRPNVGKSTLFNRLTRSRDALVADFPVLPGIANTVKVMLPSVISLLSIPVVLQVTRKDLICA